MLNLEGEREKEGSAHRLRKEEAHHRRNPQTYRQRQREFGGVQEDSQCAAGQGDRGVEGVEEDSESDRGSRRKEDRKAAARDTARHTERRKNR